MSNLRVRTPDVEEIQDVKIKATSAHTRLNTIINDNYDTVLSNIASAVPTLVEKDALDAADNPSILNPYITFSELTNTIDDRIPWRTIGPTGSEAEFTGDTDAVFAAAFLSGDFWYLVAPGTYTFSSTVAIPSGVKLVGVSPASTTITGNISSALFTVGTSCYVGYMSLTQQDTSGSALGITAGDVSLEYLILTQAGAAGKLIDASGTAGLKMFALASNVGQNYLTGCTNTTVHGCLFDSPAISASALYLDACTNTSVTSCIFKNGTLDIDACSITRAVANHFDDGINDTGTSTLLRANTPNTVNNEQDDFAALLSYIGSPSLLATSPIYSNNYSGPAGQDLTARASALDLLLQWRYEERNFHLVAAAEVTTVTWNHLTETLTSSGDIHIQSIHRDSYWNLGTLNSSVPAGSALYFVLDRTLTTTPISLSPMVATLGTIPNNSANQQVYVLAFNQGGTLWWRGGGGTRFPATGTQIGVYFVDGSSKSLLDYIGAPDYNASEPQYTSNFSGLIGESLVVRTSKNDELIRTLYQNSNISVYLADNAYFTHEGTTLSLSGTLYLAFPHVTGRKTLGTSSWSLSDGQLVYLTLNLGGRSSSLGASDSVATASVSTTVPLPDDYYDVDTLDTVKYFLLAYRKGDSIFLWDGTELPVGGRYPIPRGRSVIATDVPSTLPSNTYWDGTDFRWEKLALAVGTGAALTRNSFADQTTVSAPLTTLADGDALKVTHTWNAGANQSVSVSKVATPLAVPLKQNEFIWVQRKGSIVVIASE